MDYLLKRRHYSLMKYEEFKRNILPNYKYYLYNHYLFDMRTGNIYIQDIGISKEFVNFFAINKEYFNQAMKKFGIIEFLKKDFKTAATISYFNQIAYNTCQTPYRFGM